ncbi:hypothetical protein L596_000772 [Steinernema carpocapsae]|uniref:Uncharacterized protein n=1 Tax=Steinernema carpocapsae TaxID=34508 RepID=A0A4U8UNB0_STECR|nr:hypothetical protein L596_000772 [Steinernema carpocapsae]
MTVSSSAIRQKLSYAESLSLSPSLRYNAFINSKPLYFSPCSLKKRVNLEFSPHSFPSITSCCSFLVRAASS